jgi:hypothetical protein
MTNEISQFEISHFKISHFELNQFHISSFSIKSPKIKLNSHDDREVWETVKEEGSMI